MNQQLLAVPSKHVYTVPEWLNRVPEGIFPQGPKRLYCYFLVFGRTGCWQYNYRLAQRFHVDVRSIRRWVSWLSNHRLIHITQPYNRRRRLYAHNYDDQLDWLAGKCFAEPTKAVKKLRLTDSQIQGRKDRILSQLSVDKGLPILPFPDMPVPPHGG